MLLAGLVCAGLGGELFVRGAIGVSQWARIPAGIVGATIAAFATSSPELSVSVSSALAGRPAVALGDAAGSNVVNIGVVLGLAVVAAPLSAPRSDLRLNLPMALVAPIVLAIAAADGQIARYEGAMLLCAFAVWLGVTAREARRHRHEGEQLEAALGVKPASALVRSAVGLVLLVAAGKLIVSGAVAIATAYGMAPYVIGATVVAIGTSMPELATVVIAGLRGHQEVALGTLLGSNIFNAFFIVGVASSICAIPVGLRSLAPALLAGLALTLLAYPPRSEVLGRARGAILLTLYAVFVTATIRG